MFLHGTVSLATNTRPVWWLVATDKGDYILLRSASPAQSTAVFSAEVSAALCIWDDLRHICCSGPTDVDVSHDGGPGTWTGPGLDACVQMSHKTAAHIRRHAKVKHSEPPPASFGQACARTGRQTAVKPQQASVAAGEDIGRWHSLQVTAAAVVVESAARS